MKSLKNSRFLLNIDYDKLIQSGIHNKTYWVVATEAAIVVGKRGAATGIRKRTQHSKHPLKSPRARLGITDVDKEIQSYDLAYTAIGRGRTKDPFRSSDEINTPSTHKSDLNTSDQMMKTNKRYKPEG